MSKRKGSKKCMIINTHNTRMARNMLETFQIGRHLKTRFVSMKTAVLRELVH